MVVDILKPEPLTVPPGQHYIHQWVDSPEIEMDLDSMNADYVSFVQHNVIVRRLRSVTYNEQGERFENERMFAIQDMQINEWVSGLEQSIRDLREAIQDKDLALSKALRVARDCKTMTFWQRLKFLFTGKAPTWL